MKQFHWYLKHFEEYLKFEKGRISVRDREWKDKHDCSRKVLEKMNDKFLDLAETFKPVKGLLKPGCDGGWPDCCSRKSFRDISPPRKRLKK